tara:strand:+ start:415 stop:525 length:111 start_codon:yes stop_codon:yes gene_type:complete
MIDTDKYEGHTKAIDAKIIVANVLLAHLNKKGSEEE